MTLRRSPIERTAPWRMCRTCHRKGTKREKEPCSHPLKPVGKCGQCGERRPLVHCHRYNFEPLDRVDKLLRKWREPPRKRIRVKKRDPQDFARIYGSKEKMAWIKAQSCFALSIPGTGPCDGPIDPCHTETGGMGYKAGHETIVAGCRRHHRRYDQHKPPFDGIFRETVKMMAKLTTATWERILKAQEDDGREARESLHDRVSPHAS